MATTIAVYHRFVIFGERIECVIEHRIHQRRVRACSYRPAHNMTIKAVDNRRQIDFSSRELELRNIGQPLLIWPARTKIPREQIFWCRADFSAVRVVSSSPGARNNELFFCHESADNQYIDIVAAGIDKQKLSDMVGKPVETIPQVFLDDVPIGGYTEFAAFASTL